MRRSKKRNKFNNIVQGIKSVKIQGAQNIAKKALEAYMLFPGKKSRKKLLSVRPTEPLLKNVLSKVDDNNLEKSSKIVMDHFQKTQSKINKFALKLIKNRDVIFTHCHSSTVNKALINAKKKGKKFQVYATETRPLYQGRKTVKELSAAGIKTTFFVDSAAMTALTKSQGTKKANKFFLGSDALLKQGIVNKIGSGMFSRLAYENKVPVYIFADSWKFTNEKLKMEQRPFSEILKGWSKPPKNINIKNPAFEFVQKKYIKKIVSELGILSYSEFLKKAKS